LGDGLKKDEKESYVDVGTKKEQKTLGDLIDDIYDKLFKLNDELLILKDHSAKLTLQGNKILKMILLDEKDVSKSNVEIMEEFDKEYYIESLIRVLVNDGDFKDLQKLLEDYSDELSLNQYGEA
jgi:hypothetical protein|tara:strand:- start:74 stop:445 length:372 start_codon:yes stop_codon:yes gene_type:complete